MTTSRCWIKWHSIELVPTKDPEATTCQDGSVRLRRRRQEARKNRLAILDAARRRFLVDGYARTSIAAVAKEGRVSPGLVYRHFSNEKRLVLELLNCAVTGELDAPKVLEQERVRAVLNEPEQRRQSAMFAVDIAGPVEGAQPIDHVIRSAGEVMLTSRRCTRRCTARDSGPPWTRRCCRRPRTTARRSRRRDREATVWGLASPETRRQLVDGIGWSQDQYAAWLHNAVENYLLGAPEWTE